MQMSLRLALEAAPLRPEHQVVATLTGYQDQRVGGCRLGGVGFLNPFGEVKVDPPPFERRLARALAGCGVGLLSL